MAWMSSMRSLLWPGITPATVVLMVLWACLGWEEGRVVTNLYPLAEVVLITVDGLVVLICVWLEVVTGGNSNSEI